MSRWAFRFVLWYICILLVQPQNRFTFLYPFRIAMVCMIIAAILHIFSAGEEDRPIIPFGPATISALLLLFFSFISLHFGVMQTNSSWNADMDIILKNSICLILVEAMATTVERVWAVQATILFATLWWIKGGLRLSAAGAFYSGDRIMGPAVSLVENPNGFAYMMCLMIPLYLYFFQKAPKKIFRIGFLALAISAIFITLQTGSRTGIVILAVLVLFLLPKYGKQHKPALIIGSICVYLFFTGVGSLNMDRYKSIGDQIKEFVFGGGGEENPNKIMTQEEQSAWERKMKNKHTWALIKEYPLFGVGVQPDQDLVGEKYWHARGQVHNEWLYVGLQMGAIGMGIYASFMIYILWFGIRIQKYARYTWPALSDLGWTFKMQALVFLSGGFFSPIGWNPLFLILAGSASALWTCSKKRSWNLATQNI